MQESNTTHLVRELIRSYSLQVALYKKMNDLIEKIYGQLVLSRGDLSRVMGLFEEKQKLLGAITSERVRTQDSSDAWQRQKSSVPESDDTARLDAVLLETETTIQLFLDTEQQLEQYLKHLAEKEHTPGL